MNCTAAIFMTVLCYCLIIETVTGQGNGQCDCKKLTCSCCVEFSYGVLPNQKACAKLTFVPRDVEMKMKMMYNKRTLAQKTLGTEDVPICIPFGSIPVAVCMRAKVNNLSKNTAKVCPTLSLLAGGVEIAKQQFDCMEVKDGKMQMVSRT